MIQEFSPTTQIPERPLGATLDMDMQDAGTYLLDRSGYGNTGTPTGTTIKAFGGGICRSFNGSSDKITIADADSLDMGAGVDFSIAIWVRPDPTLDTAGATIYDLLGKYASNVGYFVALRMSATQGGLYCSIGNGAQIAFYLPVATANLVSAMIDGSWKHIVYTFTRTAAAPVVYFNGTAYTLTKAGASALSAAAASDLSTASDMTIGCLNTGNFTKCLISRVRIFKRILSATEVNAMRQSEAWDYGVKA